MDKTALVAKIIQHLRDSLDHAVKAAEEAHKGATHDQSKAETQYDTLGLEHAYLAEGQGRRITELKEHIVQLNHLPLKDFTPNDPIYMGALVSLERIENNEPKSLCVFLAPCAGGLNIQWQDRFIQVISPKSPMTQALLGLYQEDEFKLTPELKYKIQQVN